MEVPFHAPKADRQPPADHDELPRQDQAPSPADAQGGVAPGPESRTWHSYLAPAVCGFLLLAVGLVFGQTVRHEFVNFDDDLYVYENPPIARGLTAPGIVWVFTHSHGANWHPVTGLSHLLDCQVYGLNAGGHHLTNVLLHAATAILLFLVLWRMTGGFWASTLVAALFAVHPLRVESVAWVTERKDILSGLFFTLTLGAYVWYVSGPFSLRRYLLLVVVFTLGLMAKAMLVTLPLLLLLLDYWPLGRLAHRATEETPVPSGRRPGRLSLPARRVLEKLPLLLPVAVSCAVTMWGQAQALVPVEHLPVWWRIGNALISYVVYLRQLFYPVGLAVLYPRLGRALPPWEIFEALLVLVGVTAATLVWRQRFPYLLVGWLWYLGMLVPVIGLVQVGISSGADRFTYLPQIGLYVALAWGAADVCRSWPYRRWVCGVASALVLAVLMGCAWRQTSSWRDSETLWTHALACTSRNCAAHYNLGIVLDRQGRLDETLAHYQQALAIDPNCAEAHNNMGVALVRLGRLDEALAHYRRALELWPDYAMAHHNLGSLLGDRRHLDEAIAEFRRALEINPDFARSHGYLAVALAARGQIEEALGQYGRALEIDPNDADVHWNLGNTLARLGRLDEAVAHYRTALQIDPRNEQAYFNLGTALACRGRFDDAATCFRQALEIQPNHAGVHNGLGLVLAGRARHDAALAHYRTALKLQPGDAEIQKNLAWLQATCPEAALRNGNEAMELARQANQSSGGKRLDILDVLAAAYAEAGWYAEAQAAERKTLELATQQNDRAAAEVIRARLALYEAGRPYHQIRSTAPPLPPKP